MPSLTPTLLVFWYLLGAIIALAFSYFSTPMWSWMALATLALLPLQPPLWMWGIWSVLVAVVVIPPIRERTITRAIATSIRKLKLLPKISATEQAAIDAGTVWVEGEFFTGKPDFEHMLAEPMPQLTDAEQAFIDGPVERVCAMASDWDIYQQKDLPAEVWNYLKQERFFGMAIPTEYGGLGFSSLAYSTTLQKLASRSFVYVATVGVANSLGPAKLLLRYGTDAQKDYYLPRLARGKEIPCFALTEPTAGSDAASITSNGVVFKGEDDQLYLRLNWKKRYITMGAIATLLGLAFQLKDPENLLETQDSKDSDADGNLGITCALIPTNTPGVTINQRHDPMGVPFYNSPTEGYDVIVPIDNIIGGIEQAGNGWSMLVQSLAAGRGLSFPAACSGVAKLVTRVTGDYTTIRHQFGRPIAQFEGIQDPLARIASFTYLIDAARLYTCGAVDRGEQPAVVSAIAKYSTTELTRRIITDGMDILGGAGICRGPHNLLANLYTAIPIAITVEGANILTRSLMIFGQGAIRSHPYIYKEIQALEANDLTQLDQLLWPHLASLSRHSTRSFLLTLSGTRIASTPQNIYPETAPYYRRLARLSALFALLTDLTLLTLGGTLKRKEFLAGRFADLLMWQYLSTATLWRYQADGAPVEDLPLIHWTLNYTLNQLQTSLQALLQNLDIPVISTLLRLEIGTSLRLFPISRPPSDRYTTQVAKLMQTPGSTRDRLTHNVYIPSSKAIHPEATIEPLARLEYAYTQTQLAAPILKKLRQARRAGHLTHKDLQGQMTEAIAIDLITPQEAEQIHQAHQAQLAAIQVDAFSLDEYYSNTSVKRKEATKFSYPVTAMG